MRLDHVQLAIPAGGEELADAFYVGLLGMVRDEKPAVMAARGGRWYHEGDCVLHLGVDPEFRPARKAHPAIVVDDYDALIARLEAAGYPTTPNDEIEGVTRCHVADPFGNRLELLKPD